MGTRYDNEDTPEGRLAAIADSLLRRMSDPHANMPDFADFKEAFEPYMKKEGLLAMIGENEPESWRARELRSELQSVETFIKKNPI